MLLSQLTELQIQERSDSPTSLGSSEKENMSPVLQELQRLRSMVPKLVEEITKLEGYLEEVGARLDDTQLNLSDVNERLIAANAQVALLRDTPSDRHHKILERILDVLQGLHEAQSTTVQNAEQLLRMTLPLLFLNTASASGSSGDRRPSTLSAENLDDRQDSESSFTQLAEWLVSSPTETNIPQPTLLHLGNPDVDAPLSSVSTACPSRVILDGRQDDMEQV